MLSADCLNTGDKLVILRRFIFISLLMLAVLAAAQRLPQEVVPQSYTLTFTPDLPTATFTGDEVIQVNIVKPAGSITLNSAELQFQKTTITQGGNSQEAQVKFNTEKEQATLTTGSQLSAGPASIHIQFSGILNDKLRGFYLAKTKVR